MTSIGETLRRERIRRNLDLDQISRELKISPKMLEAIEAEQFEKLPGSIFAKNFVRQYAHLLGLDEEEMAAEVQRTLQPVAIEVPKSGEPQKPSVTPIQVPRVEEWETVGDRGFSWGSPLTALALFVVAMLVCSGVYAWYQKTRQPVLARNTTVAQQAPVTQAAPPPPVAQPPAAPAPQETAATPPATDQQQAATATPTAPPPNPTTAPAAPAPATPGVQTKIINAANPNGPVKVEITAAEPTWLMAKGDGKFLFSGTLDANQSRVAEGTRVVELRLGNAGGVNIVLNGTPIGAVGPKGQVRTVQLTSGGFQIVAAPKSVPLIDPL